jgi:hypothetical protein
VLFRSFPVQLINLFQLFVQSGDRTRGASTTICVAQEKNGLEVEHEGG